MGDNQQLLLKTTPLSKEEIATLTEEEKAIRIKWLKKQQETILQELKQDYLNWARAHKELAIERKIISAFEDKDIYNFRKKFRQRAIWNLAALKLEKAAEDGIYDKPVHTICKFLCDWFPNVNPRQIRRALPAKYKEPSQSKIATRQMKGYRAYEFYYRKKTISSRPPYKGKIRFAKWIRLCKKRYDDPIFKLMRKDKVLNMLPPKWDIVAVYLEHGLGATKQEVMLVKQAWEYYDRMDTIPLP